MGIPQKSPRDPALAEIAATLPGAHSTTRQEMLSNSLKRSLYTALRKTKEKETVFIAACRFVSADKDLTPQKAVEKALRLGHH